MDLIFAAVLLIRLRRAYRRERWLIAFQSGYRPPFLAPSLAPDGQLLSQRQGSRGGSVLDGHKDLLLGLIEGKADITLQEMTEQLQIQQSLHVDPTTIWYYLRHLGLTFKKEQRMQKSSSVPMS